MRDYFSTLAILLPSESAEEATGSYFQCNVQCQHYQPLKTRPAVILDKTPELSFLIPLLITV